MSAINPTAATAITVDETPAILKVFRAVRSTVREKHPFERKTTFLKPHSVAWEKYFRHFGRTLSFFVPAFVLIFSSPVATKYMVNYSQGVYDEKPVRRSR